MNLDRTALIMMVRQANHMEGLGEAYGSFAGQLRKLAEAHEIKKLRHWLMSLGGAPRVQGKQTLVMSKRVL